MIKMPYSYNKEWQNTLFMKFIKKVAIKISQIYDLTWDLRICHCSLVKHVESIYRKTLGATSSVSSPYWALDQIFADLRTTKDDSFADVGCGKGRILAYLLREKTEAHLTGIELNKSVAAYTTNWTKRYPQVQILNTNALELDYNQFTILFLFRPFEEKAFLQFVNHLESHLTHSVKLFYYADTQSGYYLENRPHWTKIQQHWVWKKYGLYLTMYPQRWSEWLYDPIK